jgi:hypothetical protein
MELSIYPTEKHFKDEDEEEDEEEEKIHRERESPNLILYLRKKRQMGSWRI